MIVENGILRVSRSQDNIPELVKSPSSDSINEDNPIVRSESQDNISNEATEHKKTPKKSVSTVHTLQSESHDTVPYDMPLASSLIITVKKNGICL